MSSPYEFTAPDADLVLVSSTPESAEFHVHRCILAAASPFFSDMFTLPQEPNTKLPIIPVSESHAALDTLLRFVYPIAEPSIASLDELVPVLAAAIKYDFESVVTTLRARLVAPEFVIPAPTRVFAIACRFDLDAEAAVASRHTLGINVLDAPLDDDMRHISAHAYHRLLTLHRRRATAAVALLPEVPEAVKCMQCNGSSYGVLVAPKWWTEFVRRARVELGARPTSDAVFKMSYLADVAGASGCTRCPGSVLDSWKFLEDLKKQVDDLPATI